MPIADVQVTCKCMFPSLLVMVVLKVVMESLSIVIWFNARSNFFQPVLVWIYSIRAIMELWFPCHDL